MSRVQATVQSHLRSDPKVSPKHRPCGPPSTDWDPTCTNPQLGSTSTASSSGTPGKS